MKCHDFRAALHGYFARSLSTAQEQGVDEHAAACAACGELLRLAREISCQELVEFLDDYVVGEIDPARRAVFERHLALCPDCAAYLDSYRKTVGLCRSAAADSAALADPPPAGLIAAVLAARRRGI
jgi:anti-sigma factor RsiW